MADLKVSRDFTVNVFALCAAATARGEEQSRPYLCGVHIAGDARGTTYTASDGVMLITVRDGAEAARDIDPFSFLIPSEIIPTRPLRTAPRYATLNFNAPLPTFTLFHRVTRYLPELVFPDSPSIIPASAQMKVGEQVQLDPALLSRCARASEIIIGKKQASGYPPVVFPTGRTDSPCIVTIETRNSGLEAFAVVMPRRLPKDAKRQWSRPTWVKSTCAGRRNL